MVQLGEDQVNDIANLGIQYNAIIFGYNNVGHSHVKTIRHLNGSPLSKVVWKLNMIASRPLHNVGQRSIMASITPFLAFLGHMLISLIAAMHRRFGSMNICTRKNQRDSSSSPLCLDLVTSSVPQYFLLVMSLSSHSWKANNWATYGTISPCQKSKIFS